MRNFRSFLIHWWVVSRRKYVYHIVTKEVLKKILYAGCICPRNMGVANEYANADLVLQRTDIKITSNLMLHDAVPFYLAPRQPMFCKLVREKRCSSGDIVALGFDFEKLIKKTHAPYALFTTNPAYEGVERLSSWNERGKLQWHILCRWRWNHDNELKIIKRAKSACRQAEVDVFSAVPLSLLDHIVSDSIGTGELLGLPYKIIQLSGMNQW